jgi:hypothetical protein
MERKTSLGNVEASIPSPWRVRRTMLRRPVFDGAQWRILVVISDGSRRHTLQGRGVTKQAAWDDLLDQSLPQFLKENEQRPSE